MSFLDWLKPGGPRHPPDNRPGIKPIRKPKPPPKKPKG